MKIPLEKALAVTQMIVPEFDLNVHRKGNNLHVSVIPIDCWDIYINAMENASDMLLNELWKLPDVKPVTDLEPIAKDLNCLITSFNMFYHCMMEELIKTYNAGKEVSDANVKRFSKYRSKIEREDGNEERTR